MCIIRCCENIQASWRSGLAKSCMTQCRSDSRVQAWHCRAQTLQLQSDNPFDKESVPEVEASVKATSILVSKNYDTWNLRLGVVHNMLLAYRLLLAKLEVKLLRSTGGICLATNQKPLGFLSGQLRPFQVSRNWPKASKCMVVVWSNWKLYRYGCIYSRPPNILPLVDRALGDPQILSFVASWRSCWGFERWFPAAC